MRKALRSRESYPLAFGSGPSLSPQEHCGLEACSRCERVINVGNGEALMPTADGDICTTCKAECDRIDAENAAIEATWSQGEVAA